MVFLFGILRAEARTGHERSEKNVPVARFGARVRVAALSAASEPSQEAEIDADRALKENFRVLLGCAALVVSADVRAHSGRPSGHFLKTASLYLPQAALRRFSRCASRPAATFVSAKRGAALLPPK